MGQDVFKSLTAKEITSTDFNALTGYAVAGNPVIPTFFTGDITLTSAQIKSLAASPVTLVAGIPNAIIKPITAVLTMEYGGSNVFTEAGQSVGLFYNNAAGLIATDLTAGTGFIDAAASSYLALKDGGVAGLKAAAAGLPLVISQNGAEWAGNAAGDNTLVVRVFYTIISV